MGWSKDILGKLSELRVYKENGNKIDTSKYIKNNEPEYNECTFKTRSKLDWSIFDDSLATGHIIKSIGNTKTNIFSS